jgi:ligand-binding sensor domain-containing protein
MENIKKVSLKEIAQITKIDVEKLIDLPLSVVAELVAKNGAKYNAERDYDNLLTKYNLK